MLTADIKGCTMTDESTKEKVAKKINGSVFQIETHSGRILYCFCATREEALDWVYKITKLLQLINK